MRTGQRDTLVTIEKKSVSRDASFGSEVVSWVPYVQAWAFISDQSGYEQAKNGMVFFARRRLMECLYMPGVTSDMRVRINLTGATFAITSITDLPRRAGTVLQLEEYSVGGG